MAITGDERDLHVVKFTDAIDHDLQQETSLLRAVVTVEPGVMGKQTYFSRQAKAAQATEVTEAFAPRSLSRASYERRFVTPTTIESVYGTPELDIIRMASNPQNDLVRSAAMELGRSMDSIIHTSFGASANREVNGASSAATFDSANTIGVGTNTYGFDKAGTALSGDTGLHGGKLKLAKRKLMAAQVDVSRQDVIVVLNSTQATNLLSRIEQDGATRKDFLSKTPLTSPGMDLALDGYLGMRFVVYEPTEVDSSADEYVYVLTRDAVKLGVWRELHGEINRRVDLQLSPEEVVHNMTVGAVRMDEAKIVRVLCDPT